MTALYIGQHEIDDEAAFADYLKETMPFIERHGGRYFTKAGTHEMLEGQRTSRVVVVEFPSKQAIKDWYNDPGYRPLIAKRHAAARSVMIAVEGQGRSGTIPAFSVGPLQPRYCCKTRLIPITGLRCKVLSGLLFGSSFVGVAV